MSYKKLQDKIEKLQTYDSIPFIGQSYFFNDGAQLYLIFQPLCYTFKTLSNSKKVISWKSKVFLTKKLTTLFTADNILSPTIEWHENSKFCLVFKGSYLKQKNATYTSSNRIIFFYCLWIRYMVTRFKFWFYFKGLLILIC